MKNLPVSISVERSLYKAATLITAVSLYGTTAHAGIIATDLSVPASMNAGGTSVDPGTYIIGYVPNPGDGVKTLTHAAGTTVGSSKPYNDLVIQNGWSLLSEGNSYIGNFYSGGPTGDQAIYNTVTVTGTGSNWTLPKMAGITSLAFRRGFYNELNVSNGGLVAINNGYLRIGSEGGSYNTVLVESIGKVWSSLGISIGHASTGTAPNIIYPNNNNITVKGLGSLLESGADITIGNVGVGNSLTVEDHGLAKANSLTVKTDNYLQFNQGYLALKITQGEAETLIATLVSEAKVQVWDDAAWRLAEETDLVATYYATNDDAFNAIGYNDLGGYTVITTAIPEPGAVGFILVGLGTLVLRLRKQT